MTSGRREVCLTINRLRSERTFSLTPPQSVFSSSFEASSVLATTCRAAIMKSEPASAPYGSSGLGSKYQGQRGPTPSRYWKNFEA